MSRSNSRAPSDGVEPSAAPAASNSNLDVTGADTGLTLGKKKSWFSNLRDAVQKGALQAKATVDSIRGEQTKSELRSEREAEVETRQNEHHRQSVDSTASMAIPINGKDDGRWPHTSRSATASLRSHLPKHGSKHHHKRSSACTAPGRPSSEMSNILGPERFASPEQEESNAANHKRHSSLANSLVGSIRGLGRKKGKESALPSMQDEDSPAKQAETIPLPSSPINIPVAAPALELDLGPAAFMPSTFASPAGKGLNKDDVKLMDPANITTGVPKSYHLRVPAEIEAKFTGNAIPTAPRELLRLPSYFSSNEGSGAPSMPTTPMPGTNLSLEIDGANSETSGKTNVFERSVTPPTEKERKALRTMRSLDAMAEACAIAHANDEMEETPEMVQGIHPSIDDHPKDAASPELHIFTPRRDRSSGTTMSSCPSDMEDLSRQKPVAPMSWIDDQQDLCMGNLVNDDLFTSSNATGVSRPSPIQVGGLSPPQNITDEWSGKRIIFANESRQPGDGTADSEPSAGLSLLSIPDQLEEIQLKLHQFTSGPPSPVRSVALPFRPKAHETIGGGADSMSEAQSFGEKGPAVDEVVVGPALSTPASLGPSGEADIQSQPDGKVEEDPFYGHHPPNNESVGEVEYIENLASDDDTQARAQQLLASDIVLPNYDSIDSPPAGGLSPHGGPLVPELYHCIQARESPISGSIRSRTTYTPGIGDAEYKFTFDNWLRGTSSAYAPEEELRTPHRRSMDISIDSVSTDNERQTPKVSPFSSSADHTPSMGSRLEFDLKRSQRNMRYNALQQDAIAEDEETKDRENQPSFRFLPGDSYEIDANAFAFADFENAYASSRSGSPQKDTEVLQTSLSSEESMAKSLKKAASDCSALEQCLEDTETEAKSTIDLAETSPGSSSSHVSGKWMRQNSGSGSGSSFSKKTAQNTLTAATKQNTLKSRDPMLGIPATRRGGHASPNRSSEVTRTESPSGSDEARSELLEDDRESSAASLSTCKPLSVKDRVTSLDSLDKSLHLFSSPESGYQADRSSVSPSGISKGPPASRFRSLSKRPGAGKPLGEIPHNIV